MLRLLRSQNRCLAKLAELSRQLISSSEAEGLKDLPAFEAERKFLFNALALHDRQITKLVPGIPGEERTAELARGIAALIAEKEALTVEVLRLDAQVIARIERERARLAEALGAGRRHQALLSRFKSGWIPGSGEGIDQKL